jgi:sigma-E factor negative regulatory protein RseA
MVVAGSKIWMDEGGTTMNNANDQVSAAELLSALADGELDAAQATSLVQASRAEPALLQTWASYHAIGQVLRAHTSDAVRAPQRVAVSSATTSSTVSTSASTPANTQSAATQATGSPAIPVFNAATQSGVSEVLAAPVQTAANDSVFRWKLVAGVAALAAVGSMVWALVGGQGNPAGAQLAQRTAPAPAVVATARTPASPATTAPTEVSAAQAGSAEAAQVMIRDPHLDELLAAHKQFGGASALQQPAGFLRNATFQPARR